MSGDVRKEEKQGTGEGNRAENATSRARESAEQNERIDALRSRLYDRGSAPEALPRHSLKQSAPIPGEARTPPPHAIHDTYSPPTRTEKKQDSIVVPPSRPKVDQIQSEPTAHSTPPTMPAKKRIRSYRGMLMLGGLAFFLLALIVSSVFLFGGGNLISGDNISLSVLAPTTIGGGEEISLQIAVANQNTVPIESGTLIISYPSGTQAIEGNGKELGTVREQLPTVNPGGVLNIPVRARMFGEENEEKAIKVAIEYRVEGSNATFFKEAKPHIVKISSSPVTLKIDAVKSISSGQEVELKLTINSNASTPLSDILVKVTYPDDGFDFTSSKPEPVSGRDTWLIKELKPGATTTITLKGIVIGKESDVRVFSVATGVASEKNSFNLFSIFTSVKHEVAVENPFLKLGLEINGNDDDIVVVNSLRRVDVGLTFENSLDDTIYNGKVSVLLKGSGLDDVDVIVPDGFYDSSAHKITWDSAGVNGLKEIKPGGRVRLSFILDLDKLTGATPEVTIEVSGQAERVFEDRVPQKISGTVSKRIRIESGAELSSSALYSEGPFNNSGPVPPEVEKKTTYTLLLAVDNGTNDLTSAEVTATLPQYVEWLNVVSKPDEVTYSAVSRTLTWRIGNIDGKGHEELWVQVAFTPSNNQEGEIPTILESQRFRATNRFTNTTVRDEASPLTTELINDPEAGGGEGRVEDN